MSTLHLKRSSLDYILNNLRDEPKAKIIFIKKYNVKRILTILTFIPLDICNIINTYTFEEIILKINVDCYYESNGVQEYDMEIESKHYNFQIYKSYYTTTITLHGIGSYILYNQSNCKCFIDILNIYMLKFYNKHEYILPSFYHHSNINTTYITNNKLLNNTIMSVNEHAISGVQILNHKQFKHMIIIIKIITDYMRKKMNR